MGKSKYIIIFFLFLSAFLFIGESNTFFLENFQDKYTQVGYFLPTGESEEEMNHYIAKQAEKFDTRVFALDKEDGGAFSRTITIYGNEEIKERLKQDWNIREGTVKSFFSGTTTFRFEPFENAAEKDMQNCWYIDKSPEELHSMVHPGMVEYSGSFRNEPVAASSKFVVGSTWAIVLLCIVLLTLYDISYGKKEQYIRIILGAENRSLQIRKILSDLAGLTAAAILAFVLLLPFTTPSFEQAVTIGCIVMILSVNSLLIWCGMELKKASLRKIQMPERVLRMGIGLKGLAAVLTVIVLSITLGLSVEGIKLYSQREYYVRQENRVHVDIQYPYDNEKMEYFEGEYEGISPFDTRDQVMDNFMRYSYRNLDCRLLYNHSYEEIAPLYGEKYIYANLQGIEQYKNQIPKWEELCSKEGNYILVSDEMDQGEVLEELLSFSGLISLTEENLSGIFIYEDGLSVITEGRRDSEFDYSYRTRNPVIILDTYDYGKLPLYEVSYSLHEREAADGVIFHNTPYLMQFISVADDRQSIENFADSCDGDAINAGLMEFSIENIGDWFNGLWALQNRSLLIAVILTILLLVLELQITALVLRITYDTHAKELTIKKVLGYSLSERYRGFFVLSGVLCSLTLIFAWIVFLLVGAGILQYMIYGSLIVWVLDWFILVYLTHKNETLEIQKVLKGGI